MLELLEASDASTFSFTYPDDLPLVEKAETLAHRLYGASSVTWDGKARRRIDRLQADGYGGLPVCVAKTQYSFSTDATLRGAPSGHVLHVRGRRTTQVPQEGVAGDVGHDVLLGCCRHADDKQDAALSST